MHRFMVASLAIRYFSVFVFADGGVALPDFNVIKTPVQNFRHMTLIAMSIARATISTQMV